MAQGSRHLPRLLGGGDYIYIKIVTDLWLVGGGYYLESRIEQNRERVKTEINVIY